MFRQAEIYNRTDPECGWRLPDSAALVMRSAGMNEFTIETIHARVIVVGSGAAGFAAANALYDRGVRDVVIVTEHINCGTSRNTGSDKQTYYKLSLCGDDADSVRKMAETLYDGGCMDGDLALAEAAGSAECFFDLVRLGVPFPRNRYGEYHKGTGEAVLLLSG